MGGNLITNRTLLSEAGIAYGNSTGHASKYKVHKLHQKYILIILPGTAVSDVPGVHAGKSLTRVRSQPQSWPSSGDENIGLYVHRNH